MKLRFALVLAVLLSCASEVDSAPPAMTPMQLQAVQQKEFDADKQAVFSSIVDVFQDLGYTLTGAELNTGFITAESATKNKTSFWDALGYATGSGNTRATAFVETMPSKMTRVRLNFVSTKTSSSLYGQSLRNDKPILDPKVYQAAFEKIDEALFVRKSVNTPVATGAPSFPGTTSTPSAATTPQ